MKVINDNADFPHPADDVRNLNILILDGEKGLAKMMDTWELSIDHTADPQAQ